MRTRNLAIALCVLAVALAAVFIFGSGGQSPSASSVTAAAADDAAPRDVSVLPTLQAQKPRDPSNAVPNQLPAEDAPRTALPPTGTKAQHRVWAQSEYGPGERQLGFAKIDNEELPPQGFAITRDGGLLVLDTVKRRLVWYSAKGEFERAIPLPADVLRVPADVSISDDGSIVVVDHGMKDKGVLILDADGEEVHALPHDGSMSGMYTVGNDIYVESMGVHSRKLGDTSGSASDEAPNVFQQDDASIPGFIAPDGRTVVSSDIDGWPDGSSGRFSITAIRGSEPEHLFTRFYKLPVPIQGVLYTQLDAAGRIYVVLAYDNAEALLCLDGRTGDPVGLVPMPNITSSEGGTQFRRYRVVPTGGLVATINTRQGVSYEWFNCF